MFVTLRDFVNALDAAGELQRVHARVSPILEIAEIADRQSKLRCAGPSRAAERFDPDHCGLGGRALLFENVEGADFPVAINVFGSYRRTEMALGCHERGGFESIASRIAALTKPDPPSGIADMLRRGREFLPLLRVPPRRVRRGICQQVVHLSDRGEVDLMRLPTIKCWPLDGDPTKVGYNVTPQQARTAAGEGRYITIAGMHTIHADDADRDRPSSHNIGMYRAQLVDATHLVMHWHMHHDGAAHWRSWKAAGKPMPIAICLGGESVLPYAATAPLPPGMSELLMAGFLNRRGIPLVRARTVPLWVPANSEIVIEGWVSTKCGGIGYAPGDEALGPGAAFEGPFGDHTGYYSLPDRYPLVEVSALTHRRDAIYPTTIVGPPPQEDYYLGKATERIFLPLLQTLIPDIDDYHLPMFGCFHNCAFIRLRKVYPLQARRIMHAIWGAGQMAWTKIIIVVDHDVKVHDEESVLHALFEHCHFARDIELVNGPLDILDHAAPHLGAGHKIGFDATRTIQGEDMNGIFFDAPLRRETDGTPRRNACEDIIGGPIVACAAPEFGRGRCLFLAVAKECAGDGLRAIEMCHEKLGGSVVDFIIAVNGSVDVTDWRITLFHMCANIDPGRDLIALGAEGAAGGDPRFAPRIAFDATSKLPGDERLGHGVRDYPPPIEMDAATKALVRRRWGEYGFGNA